VCVCIKLFKSIAWRRDNDTPATNRVWSEATGEDIYAVSARVNGFWNYQQHVFRQEYSIETQFECCGLQYESSYI